MLEKKNILLALATTFLASIMGLILVETNFWKSNDNFFVCEICQFHPKLGWETIPAKTVSNKKVTYTTNSLPPYLGMSKISWQYITNKSIIIPYNKPIPMW